MLVNNAGGQYFTPAEAIEPKGWRAVTRLNVGATERMARLAADRAFGGPDGGTIVNVTLSPHHGFPGMAHSAAARAAVEGYTRALADEWAPRGIAVVAIAAGHYDTESLRKYPEIVWRSSARSVPLQRLGREQEHAWLVALCCSPLGAALSGSVVTLDGARDNWFGPWPPPALALDDGGIPAEERPAPLIDRGARGYDPGRPLRAKCCGCTEAFQASRAGSIPVARLRTSHGEWRSLVAHPAGGRAVAGSNPVSPIEREPAKRPHSAA